MPARTPPTSLHGAPRHQPLFPAGLSAARNAIVVPSRIDATTAPGDNIDITFDWLPGVPSSLRIPKATAIALGSDLLGLGSSQSRQLAEFSNRAPAVAPPATVARFPGPAPLRHSPAAETAALPPRGRSRRAGSSSQATLFAWTLIGALALGAIALWTSGVGHVGD